MSLDNERAYLQQILPGLLENHRGKFVLIIGQENLGTFDRVEDAYERGLTLRGNVPMLIKEIREHETVANMPTLTLGLANAHP